MTIDEAINDFKKMAENARNDTINGDNLEPQEQHYNSQLELYANEKEQLAEWLEELKILRENANGYNKEDIELNRKAMYNKAIDDFVTEIKMIQDQDEPLYNILWDEVAEQLKVGRE